MAGLVLMLVLTAMTGAEMRTRSDTRRAFSSRFVARASTAASFVQSDISYTLDRERSLAERELASATVTQAQFASFLQALNFGPALLLDGGGGVLAVAPDKASLVGTEIASRYAHLSAAVAGQPAVSNVVASAAAGVAVTGFATPFDTPYGRRVVSGAYALADEPMGIYLSHVVPFADSPVYLIDSTGNVVTDSTKTVGPLAGINPRLAAAVKTRAATGFYTDVVRKRAFFVAQAIQGTPWTLVLTTPAATLFPAGQVDNPLPWIFLIGFGVLATVLTVMFVRGREERQQLASMAHVDALTAVSNRRGVEAALTATASLAARLGTQYGFLMIDVDHFKAVNDRYGHPAGDDVLKGIATRIRSCLRVEDVVGRWGGEEFVVLLPMTGRDGAATAAERIRACIAATPFVSSQHEVQATVSIGAAISGHDPTSALIERADAALYLAKHSGRDCVVNAPLLAAAIAST